jgi:ABC-type Co2+ transport system permease subunit
LFFNDNDIFFNNIFLAIFIFFYLFIIYIIINMFDFNEFIKRAIKYIIEGIMVAIAAYAIPKKSLNVEEIVVIALMAAATFSVLDVFVPSVGASSRQGVGLSIGAGLAGGIPLRPM